MSHPETPAEHAAAMLARYRESLAESVAYTRALQARLEALRGADFPSIEVARELNHASPNTREP